MTFGMATDALPCVRGLPGTRPSGNVRLERSYKDHQTCHARVACYRSGRGAGDVPRNSAHTGVYAAPGPRQLGGVKWTFKGGGPIVTSPAIAEGVVYIGAMDGHLYAIAQENGQEKWNFKSKMPIASSPAVAGGLVYFVRTCTPSMPPPAARSGTTPLANRG